MFQDEPTPGRTILEYHVFDEVTKEEWRLCKRHYASKRFSGHISVGIDYVAKKCCDVCRQKEANRLLGESRRSG